MSQVGPAATQAFPAAVGAAFEQAQGANAAAANPGSDGSPVASLDSSTMSAGFNDWACQIPLPTDAGDISCLKWHPLRHLLAAGTWGGQVLIWKVTDAYTRGELMLSTHNAPHEVGVAIDIKATLLHTVPVGTPVLSIAWRPCSAGDDLQDVLAVSGASSAIGIVFAQEGVLVPVETLTQANGVEVGGGVFGVGWMHFQAEGFESDGSVRAANSDVLAGEALCTPLVSATYDNTVHCTLGISGKLLAEMRSEIAKGDSAAARKLLETHGVSTTVSSNSSDSKYTSLDVAGPLAYVGVAASVEGAGPHFPSCSVNVLVPSRDTGTGLMHVQSLDTTLKLCINGVVANPRRWGSVTSFGPESRTNVNHVGRTTRQKFTYKCHRAGGPRTDGNSLAHLPTALCWMLPAASDYLARLHYRRPHHSDVPDAAPGLTGPNTFSEQDNAGEVYDCMGSVEAICEQRVVSQEVSPEHAVAAGCVPGATPLDGLNTPPSVPSPYYEYLLGRSCRYIANEKQRKKILRGPLCVSAATDGSVLFWDVDRRTRNTVASINMEHKGVRSMACATHLACDSTGSLLAVAVGPSWSRGDPARDGQAAAVRDEVCRDSEAIGHLVVFPICDFMVEK